MMEPKDENAVDGNVINGCEGELMLYLHIPFCIRKCNYCDFLSGTFTRVEKERYLKALGKEIRHRCSELSGRRVGSIFIGGGTPSVLEPAEIEELLKHCGRNLKVLPDAEISMECNPGTVDQEKLLGYRRAGVNRLSIGLQSPWDPQLKLLGRIHTWKEFLDTYEWARQAGFDNINVDLMSALPGQNREGWEETLKRILSLHPAPEHLSVYSLILEEGTPLYEMQEKGMLQGELSLPSEDEDREMYHRTGEILRKNGYVQYEISNYAKPGYSCRHNCGYWQRREYLGLGIGAASFLGEIRYANRRDIRGYLEDPLAGRTSQSLSREEAMEEFLFLGLRMLDGVKGEAFRKCFGSSLEEVYSEVIARNCRDGLLERDERGIRLTGRGLDLSNYVMAQFLLD